MNGRLTLQELATARGLPPDVLRRLGWKDIPDGVAVPWPGGAVHVRHSLEREPGRPRWTWKGKPLVTGPYGHDRLPPDVAEVVIVESEVDAVALWSARIAAVAAGGATGWRPEWWGTVPRTVRRVIVWCEDAGSAPLAAAVLASRPENGPEVAVCSPLWADLGPDLKDACRILASMNGSGAAVLRAVVEHARPARAVAEEGLAEAVAEVLGGHWSPSGAADCRCPFHGDRNPSLSIHRDTKGSGEWFFNCHAGSCGRSGPLVALALTLGLVPFSKQQFVSAAYIPGAAAETNNASSTIAFRSPAEVVAAGGDGPSWVWGGYLAAGAVTLLGGREKKGKSTLVWRLVAAMVRGEAEFLGQPVRPGPAVVQSEEPDSALAEKLRALELMDAGDKLRILSRTAVGGRPDWAASVRAAFQEAQRTGARLLVIDTLTYWAGLPADTENHAGAVQAAFTPLFDAAAAGLAVLVLHHLAKATGELRGSTALGAAADIIMVLVQEGDGSRRKLAAVGRYTGTPEALLLDWDGRDYTALGTPAAVSAAARREAVLAVLPAEPPGLTADEVAEAAELPAGRAREVLLALLNEGLVTRTGSGGRGDPFRYTLRPETPEPQRGEDFLPRPGGRNERTISRDSSPELQNSFLPPEDPYRAAETNTASKRVPPPGPPTGPPQPGTCRTCGGPAAPGLETCFSCQAAAWRPPGRDG